MMDFYTVLAKYYEKIFPLEAHKIDFIASFMPRENEHILDIGCATGELAYALAKRHYQVTGIDLNEAMIQRARDRIETENIPATFLVLDMLLLDSVYKFNTFGAIICLGNTLVHITSLSIIEEFLAQIHTLLMPGGVFMLQILNYHFILQEHITTLPLIENNDIKFERYYDYSNEEAVILFKAMLTDKHAAYTYRSSTLLYPLSHKSLDYLLKKNGFVDIAYYSDMHKKIFKKDSYSLTAVALKK